METQKMEKIMDLKMELMKGKEDASQLQALLHNPFVEDEDKALALQLAHNVFGSFNDSLAKLHLFKSLFESSKIGPDKVADDRASSGFDLGFQHFDGGKSKKRLEVIKNRRGCYRRRGQFESSVTISPIMDDGYAWRKYGQKGILNSKYPRCYFRCTYKHDQGCKAIKQVQKVDDDQEKSMYKTTYLGPHTCKNLTNDQQINVLDSETSDLSTNMICFHENSNQMKPLSKGDAKSEVTFDNISNNNKVIWHDDELGATGSSDHVEMMEYYPKMEFFHDQEVASSGSLVDLDIKTFDADIELFQW